MKKLLILIAVSILTMGISSSCSKSNNNNNNNNNNTSTYFMTANVSSDQSPWVAVAPTATNSGQPTTGVITISGVSPDGEKIIISFSNNVAPGTYGFESTSAANYTPSYFLTATNYYAASSGSLNISSISSTSVSGTFYFYATSTSVTSNSVNVTQGSFNLAL